MTEHPLLAKLTGGDRRSIGRSNEVAAEAQAHPELIPILVEGLSSEDLLIRMRAGDALEKATRQRPDLLEPHRSLLLSLATTTAEQELRWSLAQMLPRIQWSAEDRKKVVETLFGYLADKSTIVKVMALQALSDLTRQDPSLTSTVVQAIHQESVAGRPAVQARGRKLLRTLEKR